MNESFEPAPDRHFGLTTGTWMRLALLAIVAVAVVAKLLQPQKPPLPSADVEAAAADAWRGRVNYMLICRSAEPGPDGLLNVTGVLDVLELPTIPATVDLDVVMSLRPDRPGRRYELGKIDPGVEGTKGQSQPLNFLAVEAPGGSVTTVKQLRGLRIEQAGELRFLLLADGVIIAERVLVVRPTPG